MTLPHSQPIIDWFFEHDGAAQLGAAMGLDPETSRRVLALGLPMQLQAVSDYAQTALGEHQIAEAVRIIPNFPDVETALSAGQGAADLERAGDSMAPTLLREHRGRIADSVAQQTGTDRAKMRRLFDMTLPLILSRLSWRDAHALAFLPLVGKVAPSAAPLIPTNAAVPAHSVARTVTSATEERRGGFPLWLLPLLLLLLLGGCFLLRPKTAVAPAATTATNATTSSGFNIETPAPASEVSANGFKVSGTGKAGDVVTMYRNGQSVGTFTVDQDGKWSADVLDAAAPVGDVAYQFRNAAGGLLGTLPLKVSGTEAAPLILSTPEANADVPAGGFSIAGQGKAGEVYQAYEDGTNIGSFTVAPDGTWSVDVPGPAAGNHTYTILDSKGNRVLLLPLNVVSGGSAACTDAPTISVADNETVSAPFRFGGRGSAKSYTVTVWRGDRQVGTQEVKLTGDCTWSYQSNPGGQDGVKSVVRYELRPTGEAVSTPAAGKVTLTVSGSGTNFNSKGEYVGPTK